jgi:hypothetical protein
MDIQGNIIIVDDLEKDDTPIIDITDNAKEE